MEHVLAQRKLTGYLKMLEIITEHPVLLFQLSRVVLE